MAGTPHIGLDGNVPSIRHVRLAGDRLAALGILYPCHAARTHYQGGGIVRLNARRPADLAPAAREIRQ